MALRHGVVKSGQTRNVNMTGATNRMVSFVSHRSTSKPVSINYLRVMLKNLNKTIDILASEPLRQMQMIRQRQCVYNAVKMFQAAYASGDYSALKARNYCQMNSIPLQDGSSVSMRQTGDAVQRVCESLGSRTLSFDEAQGFHYLTKDGHPHIPGGFNNGDRELLGAEIDKADASVVFSPKSPEYHAAGKPKFQEYLQRVVRQAGGVQSVKQNGRTKFLAGDYQRGNAGTRNQYFDRVEGKMVQIPATKVVPDGKRR